MKKKLEPFWEKTYKKENSDTWGPPSDDLAQIVKTLPSSSNVLDIGCGEGRNAIFLAEKGFRVRAFDISEAGIRKLFHRSKDRKLAIDSWVGCIEEFKFDRQYSLILAKGIYQFIEREIGDRFILESKKFTLPGGVHIISSFTDESEQPEDLKPFIKRLFSRGDLEELYSEWDIEYSHSYMIEDEHEGGLKHHHSIIDFRARKPPSGVSK